MKSHSQIATHNKAEHWLVFAEHELGVAISAQLRALNYQVTLITAGAAYHQLDNNKFVINPNDPSDFRRIMALDWQSAYSTVLYMWGATTEWIPAEIPQAAHLFCVGALHLVQALHQANQIIPLYLATRGSQSVLGTESVNPAQTALWGMGRTLLWEQLELGCICVDLDPASPSAEKLAAPKLTLAMQLVNTVHAVGPETQVAWRAGNAYVPRLVTYYPDADGAQESGFAMQVSEQNGCYLLVGGLGSLGLKMADYLVTKGARHLVLSARRGISSEEARTTVQELEAKGASITVVAADVVQEAGVRAMLAACTKPLRGIVHVAGKPDDGMAINQSAERFSRVMASKVAGAWHLHQLTKHMPLDFFICFSSDSSLLGYPSQTSYSAANAFLDGLSHHRQAQGLPGLTINWGPWGKMGIFALVSEKYRNRMMMHGRYFLPVELALQALDVLLRQPLAQVGALPIDWERWTETLLLPHPWPFVENVVPESDTTEQSSDAISKTTATLLKQILMTPVTERRTVLEDHLRATVTQVLGFSTAQLGRQQGFFDYGFDSLTSIELRNLLQVSLDAKLPQMMAFTYPTIEKLSHYLINEVLDIEFDPISDETADAAAEDENVAAQTTLADEISELSDAEAEDELLRELEALNLI